jgi:photosystem II stability/assembly factor-like uncharacterized protein
VVVAAAGGGCASSLPARSGTRQQSDSDSSAQTSRAATETKPLTTVAAEPHPAVEAVLPVVIGTTEPGWSVTVAHFDDPAHGIGYTYPHGGGGAAIVATRDGGLSWRVVGALPHGENQFAWSNDEHGYAFDPSLAVTTDSGRSWRAVSRPRGRVLALNAMNGEPWAAVIDGSTMRLNALATGDAWRNLGFVTKPLKPDPRWISLVRMSSNMALISWDLAGSASPGTIIPAPQLATTTDAGAHWTRHRVPCGSYGRVYDAATPSTIWMMCGYTEIPAAPVAVYVSHDLGDTWQVQAANREVSPTAHSIGTPPVAGELLGNGDITAVSDGVAYTNLDRGMPEVTFDGGRTWSAPLPGTAPEGFFGKIVVLDTQHAWISQSFDPPRLWRTTDGGRAWQVLSKGALR